MPRLDIEVRSPGVERPAMQAHSSHQVDEWTAAFHTSEGRDRFIDVVVAYLGTKVVGRRYGYASLALRLNEPLTNEEAKAIRTAANELTRKRFEGDDAPKTMHDCL
jgi:hypothetical protein